MVVTSWTLSARRPIRVGLASQVELDDHDAAVGGGLGPLQPEGQAQVDQRDHPAAEIDHGAAKAGAPGTSVSGSRSSTSRTRPASSPKVSPCRSKVRASTAPILTGEQGHQLAAWNCSSSRWPAATRLVTSRIRATPPSPRMVAPEKVSTSAWKAQSALMTVWWSPMIWSTARPTRPCAGRDHHHLLEGIRLAGRARTARAGG
jgi:hypothetical protein